MFETEEGEKKRGPITSTGNRALDEPVDEAQANQSLRPSLSVQ